MRLDHLLSKEEEVKNECYCLVMNVHGSGGNSVDIGIRNFGGDTPQGNTRTHPEHDG